MPVAKPRQKDLDVQQRLNSNEQRESGAEYQTAPIGDLHCLHSGDLANLRCNVVLFFDLVCMVLRQHMWARNS